MGAPARLSRPAPEAQRRPRPFCLILLAEAAGQAGREQVVSMKRQDLLPDGTPDLREEVKRLVADPEIRLDTPHEFLGGRTPNEVMAQGDPQRVRDLLRAIKYGVMV
jgi:hypothetical protein